MAFLLISFFRSRTGLAIQLPAWLLMIGLLWCSPAQAREVPSYRGYVNDYADMISPAAEERLERALRSFDLTDSTQIAILTIDSLEGDNLEDFSIRTVDAWKIGQREKDNGILLLAVREDRRLRIEVGRGLEGVLTDLAAGRIIDLIMIPRFQAGRMDEGFEAGVEALIRTTRGEFKAERLRPEEGGEEPHPLFTYLFFGAMIIAFLGSVSRWLGMAGGAVLLPLLVLLGMGNPGLLLLLLLLPAGAVSGLLLPLLLAGFLRSGGGYYRGGYYRGGGGLGGRRGGGFGGFGGGGFGGGGASGRW